MRPGTVKQPPLLDNDGGGFSRHEWRAIHRPPGLTVIVARGVPVGVCLMPLGLGLESVGVGLKSVGVGLVSVGVLEGVPLGVVSGGLIAGIGWAWGARSVAECVCA